MKKIILTLGAVALVSFTACKKDVVKTTDGAVVENTDPNAPSPSPSDMPAATTATSVNGVDVPKFSTPEVQEYANGYAAFLQEAVTVSKSGDAAKAQEITAKTQEWALKQAEMAKKMTPEDAKLLSDFAIKVAQTEGMMK